MNIDDLVIRRALPEDCTALFAWYQQAERWSFLKRAPQVLSEQNRDWFQGLLQDEASNLLCIAVIDNIRIGAIRFKRRNDTQFHALIALRSPYLGLNIVPTFLERGTRFLREIHPEATVESSIPVPSSIILREQAMSSFVRLGITVTGITDLHFVMTLRGTK